MQKILLHIIFCIFAFAGFTQETTASLSQNSILIGEKITLTYSVPVRGNDKPIFNPERSVIPSRTKSKTGKLSNSISSDIEILTQFKDTVIGLKNEKMWIGVYEITAWDSGNFVLSAPTIILNDSTVYFPEIVLSASLVKGKQGQEIYDIKESFAQLPDEPFSLKNFTKNNWYWLVPLIIFLLIYIFYKWNKKRNKPIEQVKELSLKDRTLLAIDALERSRLWEKGLLKEHYIELSFIMRSYLSSRYEINLLEKTTHESKLLLQQIGLHTETIQTITAILSESDMVKFAKSQPEEMAVLKVSQLARQIVAETSPIEFNNA